MHTHSPAVLNPFRLTVPGALAHHLATGGPLESWTLVIALGLVAVGLLVMARWRWRVASRTSRRRTRATSIAAAATAVVVALLTLAVGVNAYAGYVPTLSAAVALATGSPAAPADLPPLRQAAPYNERVAGMSPLTRRSEVVDVHLPAADLGMPNGNAYVYLPPGYSTTRRYPSLYLLPGSPGGPSDWLYAGNIKSTADALIRGGYMRPYVIVLPRISPSWTSDYEGLNAVHGPQVMTYLTQVVIPTIDARFSTSPQRDARAIGGFSAGADAALNVALHNQSLFAAAGAIVPEGWPGSRAWWVVGDNKRLMAANSPIRYLPSFRFTSPMAFYLSGAGRRSNRPVSHLAAELIADGQRVLVHNEHGLGHTWVDARFDLPYLLQFMSDVFDTGAAPRAA